MPRIFHVLTISKYIIYQSIKDLADINCEPRFIWIYTSLCILYHWTRLVIIYHGKYVNFSLPSKRTFETIDVNGIFSFLLKCS